MLYGREQREREKERDGDRVFVVGTEREARGEARTQARERGRRGERSTRERGEVRERAERQRAASGKREAEGSNGREGAWGERQSQTTETKMKLMGHPRVVSVCARLQRSEERALWEAGQPHCGEREREF